MLYQDGEVSAFHSIHPAAKVHALVIPNKHLNSMNEVEEDDVELLGKLVLTAKKLAAELGIAQSGYRLVFNNGADAGQTVFHIHLHLLGGERLFFRPLEDRRAL